MASFFTRRNEPIESVPVAKPVIITTLINLEQVGGVSPEGGRIIRGCAFVQPNRIPSSLFGETKSTTDAMTALESAGLIAIDQDDEAFSVHEITQESIRDNLLESARVFWTQWVVERLARAFLGSRHENQSERLIPHIRAVLGRNGGGMTERATMVMLRRLVFDYLKKRGRLAEARELLSSIEWKNN